MKSKRIFLYILVGALIAALCACEEYDDTFAGEAYIDEVLSSIGTYQAEDHSYQSGCAESSKHSGYTGSGFMDYGGNSSLVEWNNVKAPSAGKYTLTFRYANGTTADRRCAVTINDTNSAGNVEFSPTGGWTTWSTVSITANLKAGNNNIRVTANTGSGGPNLDKMDLVSEEDPAGGSKRCALVNENYTATLSCPSGQVIESIDFASYGLPTGSCPNFLRSSSCHSRRSPSAVEGLCLEQESCKIDAKNTVFGDPCSGKSKKLAVVYTCSGEETGLELEDFVGHYERTPMLNNWHKVDITLEDNALRWKNAAGVTWSLSYAGGVLKTGADCPYGVQVIEVKEQSGNDPIKSLIFNRESYDKTSVEVDACPDDPNKTQPGECGCGVPEGHCEFGSNIAKGKPTSQSSTAYNGASSRAVDGNISGVYKENSVTHTAPTQSPWWEVDFGNSYDVKKVVIYNRTDCCGDRLSNFDVDYLDRNGGVIDEYKHFGKADQKTEISFEVDRVNALRIHLNGYNPLSLAEVEVWGTPNTDDSGMCEVGMEGEKASLSCPDGEVIKSIEFASYGLPTGTCETGFDINDRCHSDVSSRKVEDVCLNQQTCTVDASSGIFGDPCAGIRKKLVVVYTCEKTDDDAGLRLSDYLTPFNGNHDTNTWEHINGPHRNVTNYGKSPEFAVVSDGESLWVLAQDYNDATEYSAVLFRVEGGSWDNEKNIFVPYHVTKILTNIPMLDRVMGLDQDDDGNLYYATAVDEAARISDNYPPPDTYRTNIVRVVKLNKEKNFAPEFNVDLDIERGRFDIPNTSRAPRPLVNPMTYSTARLAVGGNEIRLVHGINSHLINGIRHQLLATTTLDKNGAVVSVGPQYMCSHCFDHRLLSYEGQITELHLGDLNPRSIFVAKKVLADNGTRVETNMTLFNMKGGRILQGGDYNNTFTRLGGIARSVPIGMQTDEEYPYMVVFSTEDNDVVTPGVYVNGPRGVAVSKFKFDGSEAALDPNMPDTFEVTVSEGENIVKKTNNLVWVHRYPPDSGLHAERPKIVYIGDRTSRRFLILWEEWETLSSTESRLKATRGVVIDEKGAIDYFGPGGSVENNVIRYLNRLPRGDDLFMLHDKAAWLTATDDGTVIINRVCGGLLYSWHALD